MIYLDHNATTPVLPEVREGMLPYLDAEWGNPSSTYRFGSKLKSKIEAAREQVSDLIGCNSPHQIIFTSGGTESNNTAIHAAIMARPEKRHIVTSQVEHSSVLTYCRFLEHHRGYRVTYLPVDREGLLCTGDLESVLTDDTALVSLMWANNETGVLFPVEQISKICHDHGVLYHCDAVQSAGKLPISTRAIHFDYLSVTGHKIGSAKGIGALYIAKKTPFVPYLFGGHQDRGRRGGTENMASIVGFGIASSLALKNLPKYRSSVRRTRDQFEKSILQNISCTELNGHKETRLPNTSNITFHGIDAEAMLLLLGDSQICASSGSACLADSPDPSHVITAMKGGEAARQSIRLSFAMSSSSIDIADLLAQFGQAVNRLQRPSLSLTASAFGSV